MIKRNWKVLLFAVGALVSAAFYLFTPEAGEVVKRSMNPEKAESLEFELIGVDEVFVEEEESTKAEPHDEGFSELEKLQIEEIVKSCLASEIESAVSASVREVITELRDDGTLTEALYNYADVQSGLININKADSTELKSLPGIGDAKAAAIIRYREETGGFKSIEELLNVSGISEKILEGIRNDITV